MALLNGWWELDSSSVVGIAFQEVVSATDTELVVSILVSSRL